MILLLAALIGSALGLLYVTLLWWQVRRALADRRWARLFAAGRLVRVALIVPAFVAALSYGPATGLVMLIGFWGGRSYLLARLGGMGHGR